MLHFVFRRAVSAVLVLFAISVFTFLIFEVIPTGDPALRMAGRTATPVQIEAIRRDWGFDRPLYVQYVKTMGKILSGSVISYSQQVNVESQLAQDLPPTLSLAIGAAVIWLGVGILFGVFSALWAGRWPDRILGTLSLVGVSTPVLVLGAVLSYYVGDELQWLPDGGYVPLGSDPWAWFTHMLMPWVTLSVLLIGVYSRVLRATILDTLHEDYVRTARAKGLSERAVIVRHVLRNSLIPIVSLWGLDFAAVGGGAILVESVFNLHGVGQYAQQSVAALDIPPVLVITMFGAFAVVLLGAVVDVLYAALDPRVRLS
jgi:peptide/nickel transport system permease protein